MLTSKKNVSARVSGSVFVVLLIYFFASWFMLAPPGAAGEAHAGQLEFDGVPVDITTAANEDLVIAPGSGGNSQIGTATGTNTHATTNNDLHITGVLEVDGVSYFDSAMYLGDTVSDTVTVTGYFGSSLIPSLDSTYDLGSTSLAWRYLYADIISGVNADLAMNPASGYSLTGSVTKNASTGNEIAYDYAATINKAAGNYTGIRLNLTQTAAGGPAIANFLIDLQRDGVSMFNVDSNGNVNAVGTITGAGLAINGTTSYTFTVNSNNDNTLTTLRLGGSGGSNGQLTTASGNLVIDSNGGTIDINDGTLDLSTQTVDVTLNDSVDSLNFDSNTLSIDAFNNRVGILTATPDLQLHVVDSAGETELAKFESSGSAAVRIDAAAGPNTSTVRNYVGGVLLSESGYTPLAPGSGYYVSVGGTRYLTLDANGYLGLGDTTPVANLVVGSDAGAAVAGAGDAYIQNDLEVDGTLYAASASIAGTDSDTFTIDTDNTSATPTLTFGNGGNPFITTPAGNLNLQPASAVIVRDGTAPAPAKATAAGSMFVENVFENTGIAYHYDDITMYDKKSFAVISSASGNPDYAHSIYISQSDNIMQFKEWDTFKFTNTSADVDLITLTPTAGMALLNEDVVDNAVSDILKIQHSTTNAPQAGIGTGLAYYVEDAGNLQKHGSIDTVLTTVTQGSENADMVFKISQAGTLTELLRLNAASDRVDVSGDMNVTGAFSAGSSTISGTTADTFTVNSDNTAGVTTTLALGGAGAGSGEISTTAGQLSLKPANNNVMLNAAHLTTSTPNTYNIGATNERFERIFVNNVGDRSNPASLYLDSSDMKFNDSVHGDARFFFNLSSGDQNYVRVYDSTVGDYENSGQLTLYHDGVNGGILATDKNGTGVAGDIILLPNTGLVGLITTSPTYNFGIDGTAARTMGVERNTTADTAGSSLTINAGGATSGATNKNGGALYLASGVSTGTGSSSIIMQTAKAGAGGDNAVATRATINGTGATLSPHGTAAGNTLELRFAELAAGGSEYIGFKAPDAIGTSLVWTLPSIDGSDGQVLKTDGLGVLSFGSVGGSTSITGTTNDTFEVNSDGNSVTIDSTGQTSDHSFTFPDATGQVMTNNMPADVAVTLGGGVDALNFDSNTLSIDASADRVGIGTAAPESKLEVSNGVAGGSDNYMLTLTNPTTAADSRSGIRFYVNGADTAGAAIRVANDGATRGDMSFITMANGSDSIRMFIDAENGYVGIADNSPVAGLVVGDDTGATVSGTGSVYINNDLEVDGTLYAAGSSLTGTTNRTFTVNSDNTTDEIAELIFGGAGTGSGKISTTAGNLNIDSAGGTIDINDGILDLSTQTVDITLNAAADALNFDSDTLSIDASAHRVGIGTASPQYELDVINSARVNSSSGTGSMILSGAGDTYKYSSLNLSNDAGDKLWALQHRQVAGQVNNFCIEEYDGVDYYQRLSIIPGGYVGIGDVSPVAQLVVGSDAGASVSGAGSAYIQSDLEVDGTLYAGASTITGTTSDTFEVNTDGFGAVISTTNRSTDGTYTLPNVAGAAQILATNMSDGAVAVTLNAAANNGLSFDTDTLSIDAQNHRVGIGTTSPSERLTIDGGNSYSGYVETKSTNANYCGILFRDADGVQWGLYKNATADPVLQFGRYTDGVWQAAPITFMRNGDTVFADNYVGIAETSPVCSLAVGDDSAAALASGAGSVYILNDLEVGSQIGFNNVAYLMENSGIEYRINSVAGHTHKFLTGDTELMHISQATDGDGVLIEGSSVTTGNALRIEVDAATMTTGYPLQITRDATDMLHITESGGIVSENVIASDTDSSNNLILGEDGDATIGYDGTNLLINPQVVGSGKTIFTGDVDVGGLLTVGSASLTGTTSDTFTLNSDNTTGVTTTLTFGGAGAGTGSITTTVGNLTIAPNGATTSVTGDVDVSGRIEIDSANAINNNGTQSISAGELAGANNAGTANTFMGYNAGTAVSSGGNNTAIGWGAGEVMTTTGNNTFVGSWAGRNSTGQYNTYVGYGAGWVSSNCSNNVFVGYQTGNANTASNNTFVGYQSGRGNSTGTQNTFLGQGTGYVSSSGSYNTFIGHTAGRNNTASNNTFMGNVAGLANTSGDANTFLGAYAGTTNTLGASNVFVGRSAGYLNLSGGTNVFVGDQAGYSNSTGAGNVCLGFKAGYSETGSNKLYIDNSDTASPLIYGDFSTNTVTINGTLNATTSAFSGTTADTFTVNSDGTAATSTLALGAAGTTGGSITTGAGNLTIDSTGGTIDINDGIIDLSTQTVDITLNAAADALNFDSNTLTIDASQDFVGIGTAAPDYLLTIAPPLNAEASMGMASTSGAGAEIYFGHSGSYDASIGYNQNFEGAIEFKTNGTSGAAAKMIISEAGNVGIGTGAVTQPAAALDVQTAVTAASANAYGVRLQQTLTAAADNDALNSLYINTTYADGGFSGVKHNGIAFPDAQGAKINLGYDAAKAKWIGIDGSWRQGFANDTGFEFYISSTATAWGDSKLHIDTDSADFYVDPVVGTSGTNRWLKMFGNILFEESDDYIGTYSAGTITLGNIQDTSTATTFNFGRSGGVDIMNLNRGGTTYNFLTLTSAGTDDITLDPAGNDVLPGSDSTDNLGSSSVRWLNGYFDNVYCANQNATNYVTGSDIAENVNSARSLEPGTVVIIDPDNDSHIVPCKTANDTRVAGIISTKPAVWMGAKENKMGAIEEKEPGKEPLALAGRVPCKVDAGYGPIKRGDLLTTSPTEGHAMVARDPQIGAVVGKAMQSLESGKGTIEVLVVLR